MPDNEFDAVFVGSGFGAAVTACRLVPHFERSCLLERGREYGPEDFPRVKLPEYLTGEPQLRTSQRLPDAARLGWSFDQGLFDVRNLGRLRVVQAAGLGGGSLIYANVQLCPPKEVFESWPALYRDGDALDQCFAAVMNMLGAKPWPENRRGEAPKAELMQRAAKSLERQGDTEGEDQTGFFYPPLAIDFDACTGCGNCTIGCQQGAKNTVDKNYLRLARGYLRADGEPRLEVRTLCEVMYLQRDEAAGRYEVVYFDHLTQTNKTVKAEYVFLGAGAVGTTEILFRSQKRGLHAERQTWGWRGGLACLGKNFFANGDNLGVVFDTEEYAAPSQGPTITSAVLHVPRKPKEPDPRTKDDKPLHAWFLIEDGGIPPHLEALLGYFWSPRWLWRNSLTTARRRDRSWLRPITQLGDRAIADFELAAGDLAGALMRQRTQITAERAKFPQEWIEFIPESAKRIATQLKDSSDLAIAELRRFQARLLEKLARDTWYLSRLVLDQQRVIEKSADTVAELYPPLRQLLRDGMGFESLASALKFLLLGKPPSQRTLVLLAMGPDPAGDLHFDARERMSIRWRQGDSPGAPLFALQERLMRDFAVELGGELRTNPDWALGRRAVTVHAQGGCGMAEAPTDGGMARSVTDPQGRVLGFDKLYVVDAAAFPTSVGANPSCTIAAVAELKAREFIRDKLARVNLRLAKSDKAPSRLSIGEPSTEIRSQSVAISWREELRGVTAELDAELNKRIIDQWRQPEAEALDSLLELERQAVVNTTRVHFELHVILPDFDVFAHAFAEGTTLPKGTVSGTLRTGLKVSEVTGSASFDLRVDPRVELSGMTYELQADGKPYVGVKVFRNDPGYDVWKDLTTLFVTDVPRTRVARPTIAGILRVTARDFFTVQLPSYEAYALRGADRPGGQGARENDDPNQARFAPSEAARAWALARFAWIFYRGFAYEYAR